MAKQLPATVHVLWLLLASCAVFISPCSSYDPVDWLAMTVPENPPLQYKGDGTFYGKSQDKQGACGFSSSAANSLGLPWTSGTSLTVAVNDFQYADGLSCGMCIKLRGVGTGIGTVPIPQTWQYALVNNRCPECAPGSLDLALNGNGRWQLQWVPVPCNVGQSTFFYHVVSPLSNPYYFAFSVSNTRIPLRNVELESNGKWAPLRRDVSNSWNANGGTYKCPLHIRLTSVLGDVVEDWVPSNKGGQGTAQFPEVKADPSGAAAAAQPLTPDYPGITSGDAAPVAVHWNAPNGTWVATTSSNPASPGAAVRLPTAPAQASSTSGSSAAAASASSSSGSSQGGSGPSSSPSPSSSTSKGTIAAWQQCGGTYRCTSNCADAAYTDMQCASGSTCMRYDSTWWQCRPQGQGFGSSPSESSSGSSASGSSSASSSGSSSDSSESSSSSDDSSSSSGSSASASTYGGSSASANAGGNVNADSSSSGGASAAASAGRRLLRS